MFNIILGFEMFKSIIDFRGYDVFVYIWVIIVGGFYIGVKGKVKLLL